MLAQQLLSSRQVLAGPDPSYLARKVRRCPNLEIGSQTGKPNRNPKGLDRSRPAIRPKRMRNLALLVFMLIAACSAAATDNIYRIYAVDETHKITRNDTTARWMTDSNLVWVRESVNIFGGRNEVVGFQLMIQAKSSGKALNLNVTLDSLYNDAYTIKNSSKDPTQYVGRYIELFKEQYARIDSQGSGSGSLMWYFYPGRGSTDGHPDYAGPSDYYRPKGSMM